MIELRGVHAGRPGNTMLKDFSWRINDGENWLIQGDNGGGKTLLLELLAGKVHPTSGEVCIDFIDGQSWDERFAQRKRHIHYVPTHAVQNLLKQDQHQYYQQRYYSIGDQQLPTVRDLLGEGAENLVSLKLPAEFSIDDLLPVEANRLSNGQMKKLLLIKVLLTGIPRMLLLDYPFEGLDRASRQALCRFIDFLCAEHKVQVILVDQHNELPMRINRRLILDDFRIALEGEYSAGREDSGYPARQEASIEQAKIDTSTTDEHLTNSIRTSGRQVDADPGHGSAYDPIVEVSDLRIQYGERIILQDFNWRVNRGERWALVGRNGAGKTTLFSMIFADHPMAYSQQVHLFGRRRGTGESIWDIKRRISYLGPEQLSYLSPTHIHVSALNWLKMSLKNWDPIQLDRLVTAFRAGTFMETPVRILSSGQLQIVLIIKCLLADCELLLLDEPFQFLDSGRKQALNEVLDQYLEKDKTLILITHYAADLAQWTNHTKMI